MVQHDRRARRHGWPARGLAALAAGAILVACGTGEGGGTAAPAETTSRTGTVGSTAPTPSPSPVASFPVTLTDDDGVEVTVPAPPERIVTWAPSNTEIVFALGLGDRVVGVSGPFDDHPPEAEGIEHVSGTGGVAPDVEKVVSLEPDLVLNGFLGGDAWKAQLRDLAIPVFSIYAADFEDAVEDIRTVGAITGGGEAAGVVAEQMAADALTVTDAVGSEDTVTCFLEVGYPDLYTVGPQDFPFHILELAGCAPVTSGADAPYPLWSLEQLAAADPDVYFVTTEAGVAATEVGRRPGFAQLSAVVEGRVVLIDSGLITRPGPRLVEGLEALAQALHPGAFP